MGRMQEFRLIETLYRLEERLYSAFTARGIQISFKRVYADKKRPYYGFFEVKAAGLPDNTEAENLLNTDLETFLSSAIGYQVKAMTGKYLTYCVRLGSAA